jgi:translation initiation factor IF-1
MKKLKIWLKCVEDKKEKTEKVAKEEALKFEGRVTEVLGNAMFRVRLKDSDHEIVAYLGGKLRQNEIKIIAGDVVTMEVSPYDMNKGRIMFRH